MRVKGKRGGLDEVYIGLLIVMLIVLFIWLTNAFDLLRILNNAWDYVKELLKFRR